MQSIIELMRSGDWWISVVIVGILINIFSSALINLLPRGLGLMGKKWQIRSENARIKRDEKIKTLASSVENIFFAAHESLDLKINVIYIHVKALVFFALGSMVNENNQVLYHAANAIAVILLVFGLKSIIRHGQFSLLLTEARILRLKQQSENS